jgi:tetratricopeptide (TPR) repeat protein
VRHSGLEIGAHHVTLGGIMSIEHPNLKRIVAASAVIVTFSFALLAPLHAQEADLTDESALLTALAQANPAEAKRVERQLLALWNKSGSDSMDLLLERGRKALEADDTTAAIEHLTALTDHAPDFAEGWYARATAYYAAGLYGPAVADLETALRLNPNNYNAIIGLAALFETFNDPTRAYEAYRRAEAIHPNNDKVAKALARLKPEVEGKTL